MIRVARLSVRCSTWALRCASSRVLAPYEYWVRSEICSRTQWLVGANIETYRRKLLGRGKNRCKCCGSCTRRRVMSVILCEKCTNNSFKKYAYMQPVDRVAKVLFKVFELMNGNAKAQTSMHSLRLILAFIGSHSSRQGKVVFVRDALSLVGANIEMFRYVNRMLPKNY